MARARAILIVESDPHVRRLISTIVRSLEMKPIDAGNGSEAEAMANKSRPAAITLCDDLPDIDWSDLVEQLRGDPKTSAIPVIAVMMPGNVYKAMKGGCVALVQKPFDAAELKAALREHAI